MKEPIYLVDGDAKVRAIVAHQRRRRATRVGQGLRMARVITWAAALWWHNLPVLGLLVSLYVMTSLAGWLFKPPAPAGPKLPRNAWYGVGKHRVRFNFRSVTPDELRDAEKRMREAAGKEPSAKEGKP